MNDRKKQPVAPDSDKESGKQDCDDLIQLIAKLVARRHLTRFKNQQQNEEEKTNEDKKK